MKQKKMFIITALAAAVLASCGGGSQGKPNLGDIEYVVRTMKAQSAEL